MWNENERIILEALDRSLRRPTVRASLDALARRAAAKLAAAPHEPHSWESVPLECGISLIKRSSKRLVSSSLTN